MAQPKSKEQSQLIPKILWALFCGNIGLLYFVLTQLKPASTPSQNLPANFESIFWVFAACIAVASFTVRKILFSTQNYQKWLMGNIISWVMNESIALFGFLIGRMQPDLSSAVPFFIGAFALTLLMFPKTLETTKTETRVI